MYGISWKTLLDLLKTNDLLVSADKLCGDIYFRSLSFDSRQPMTDGLFFCKGVHFKKEYLFQAQNNGAIAYLSESEMDSPLPHAVVTDMQRVIGLVAEAFYGHPQHSLRLFGVTGTNGKTTVVYHLVNILQKAFGQRPAFTSTVEIFDGTNSATNALTTPESLTTYELLARAGEAGIENYVIECSATGNQWKRLEGLKFDYGVFTNITPDHIAPLECRDFEEYLGYKMDIVRRFDNAVVNADDPHCADAVSAAAGAKRIVTYSVREDSGADVFARNISREGITMNFTVVTPSWEREMKVVRPGLFNVSNALAASAVAYLMGLDADAVCCALASSVVPGRMEYYEHNGYRVFVDYGHNKAAVNAACRTIKEMFPDASLQILFGCIGERAVERRRDIPESAAPYCTHMYITSDDPMYEDPQSIIDEIVKNVKLLGCPYTEIPDREECIRTAVSRMTKDDILLVTSKGPETSIKICGDIIPYPGDAVLVQEALRLRCF